jgi:hypothetical protein
MYMRALFVERPVYVSVVGPAIMSAIGLSGEGWNNISPVHAGPWLRLDLSGL